MVSKNLEGSQIFTMDQNSHLTNRDHMGKKKNKRNDIRGIFTMDRFRYIKIPT